MDTSYIEGLYCKDVLMVCCAVMQRRVNPRTWQSLNGLWEFYGGDGPVPFNQSLPQCILVPYPMESDLSGQPSHLPRTILQSHAPAPFHPIM